jgi:hypothetical protein
MIESFVSNILGKGSLDAGARGVGIHGNRVIAGLVFTTLNKKIIKDPLKSFDDYLLEVDLDDITSKCFIRLLTVVNDMFGNTVLPTLFKNRKKCQELFDVCRGDRKSEINVDDNNSGQLDLI